MIVMGKIYDKFFHYQCQIIEQTKVMTSTDVYWNGNWDWW